MPLRSTLILLLAAALLTGCGRRGSLEKPGTPEAALAPGVTESAPGPAAGDLLDAQSPGAQEPAEDRPVAAPERPFFLDALI